MSYIGEGNVALGNQERKDCIEFKKQVRKFGRAGFENKEFEEMSRRCSLYDILVAGKRYGIDISPNAVKAGTSSLSKLLKMDVDPMAARKFPVNLQQYYPASFNYLLDSTLWGKAELRRILRWSGPGIAVGNLFFMMQIARK